MRFWAFLGKGSSKTREKNCTGEIFFAGGFSTFFPFDFFVALVKRLSVRGTQKRDKKVLGGRASIFFPPYRFFLVRFWAFLDKGNSKTRLKKSRNRTSKTIPGQIKDVRIFFFCRPLMRYAI